MMHGNLGCITRTVRPSKAISKEGGHPYEHVTVGKNIFGKKIPKNSVS